MTQPHPNGNRQIETRNASHLPYVYDPPGSNWLHQKGSELRTKTASGNTASISGLATFTYDGFNRLVTAQTAAETTTYAYNALGQRMKKSNQHGLSTVFHYGPDGELLWEKDANGNTRAYVWLDGRPLARIDNDAQIYYYHVDHLGTPQAMSDSTGSLVWQANYEPFGKATVSPASTVENNLRFPGQYHDRETGLHYNYFRDYEPGTGRYVEADPIGIEGGLNLYRYAEGNPISFTDPKGLQVAVPIPAPAIVPRPTPFPIDPVLPVPYDFRRDLTDKEKEFCRQERRACAKQCEKAMDDPDQCTPTDGVRSCLLPPPHLICTDGVRSCLLPPPHLI